MKVHFTLQFAIAIALFSAIGCKKDKNPSEPKVPQTLLVKTTTSSSITTYEYDGNNRVVKDHQELPATPSYNSSSTYTYNDKGQLIERRLIPEDPAFSEFDEMKRTYTYNSGNLLVMVATYFIDNGVETLSSKEIASYESDKISVQYTDAESGDTYLLRELFLDNNKNLLMNKRYRASGGLLQTAEYTYDNKPSNRTSIPATDFAENTNNFTSLKIYEDGTVISETTYTYEYNGDGYPTKRTTDAGTTVTYKYIKK